MNDLKKMEKIIGGPFGNDWYPENVNIEPSARGRRKNAVIDQFADYMGRLAMREAFKNPPLDAAETAFLKYWSRHKLTMEGLYRYLWMLIYKPIPTSLPDELIQDFKIAISNAHPHVLRENPRDFR